MPLTFEQASHLEPGTVVRFTPGYEYMVESVTVYNQKMMHIAIRRLEDGLETFANEFMLHKMDIVSRPDSNPLSWEPPARNTLYDAKGAEDEARENATINEIDAYDVNHIVMVAAEDDRPVHEVEIRIVNSHALPEPDTDETLPIKKTRKSRKKS